MDSRQDTADHAWQTEMQTGIKFTVENARDVFPVVKRLSISSDLCLVSEARMFVSSSTSLLVHSSQGELQETSQSFIHPFIPRAGSVGVISHWQLKVARLHVSGPILSFHWWFLSCSDTLGACS